MIPFKRAISIDFEYRSDSGECPHVWCLAARDHETGEVRTWWRDELLTMSRPPFPTDADTVVFSYAMSAEMSCFKQLGWRPPEFLLDTYAEYRWAMNGRQLHFTGADHKELAKHKFGMLAAAFQLGVTAMASARKEEMRQLAMTRSEFTPEERPEMMAYCGDDTRIAAGIFDKLEPVIDWPRALLRGRYGVAVAAVEHEGIPVDVATWRSLIDNWPFILERLIDDVNRECPVFINGAFSNALFLAFTVAHNVDWLAYDLPYMEKEYREEMATLYPHLFHVFTTNDNSWQVKLADLAIGRTDATAPV